MADGGVRFCVEDTVGLRDDKYTVGVVDRSFGDVDSHEPAPQRDYNEDIERHADISEEQYQKFMRSGIPPRGTVLVSWQTQYRTELIPESQLELLDRALYVGDVVKRDAKDPMSGTVIGTKAVCTLFPASMFNGGQLTQTTTEDFSIRAVPAEELINVHEYVEGALVIYNDWVGRIEQVYDEVSVKLANNSVVIVENADELEPDDGLIERISVGDTVKTVKGNLRRGRWIFGAFDPSVRPHGMVVDARTVFIDVRWLTRRFGGAATGVHGAEPPAKLDTEDLESGRFFIYDATRSAVSTLPLLQDGSDRSYHVAEVAVGDRVRFKDLSGAAVKYDGSQTLPNHYPQGKLARIPRTETLGYDMNVYLIMQTHTQVTVQWQDLSITEDSSPSLIPDPNVEDDDEVWPGEIVCTREQKQTTAGDRQWTFTPTNVGVIQSVQSRDRIATVRWFAHPTVHLLGDDLIPPADTGQLCDSTEDVSLYDIRSITNSLTRRRGDFVVIHPDCIEGQASGVSGPDWFGEVIDLGLDGKVTVRLGAAKPVVDVRMLAEHVTLVYSSDMDAQFDYMPPFDGDSVEGSEDGSDFDSASFQDMWIEYEGMDGEPVGHTNDEEWSTEEEDDGDDDDESMPDLESPEEFETTKTTPEAHSDGERKESTIIDSDALESAQTLQSVTTGLPLASEDSTVGRLSTAHSAYVNADGPSPFVVLESPPPSNHNYVHVMPMPSPTLMKRIAKEHKILRSSLPPGIFVRTWESRLDLLRVLMIGPSDTPYEYAPFVIDVHLVDSYPNSPPEAFFHSWTNGNGPVNPNLYEDGKICLSLLGTWHADERNESWSPAKSTLLQVLVSIMGLVLNKEPYYNEAGYDIHREAPETKLSSALYTERAYFRARGFIVHALTNAVDPFAEDINYLYLSNKEDAPSLLDKAISASKEILDRSEKEEEGERDGLRRISRGAVVMLRRQVEKLEQLKPPSAQR